MLQLRQKNIVPERNLAVGDLVMMTGEGFARGYWPLARVMKAIADDDGLIRTVTVLHNGSEKLRPISKLALLEAAT